MARGVDMTKRMLLLSRYTRLGASSRLRTMQYRQFLERAGFSFDVVPFFDDRYLTDLYTNGTGKPSPLPHVGRRLATLRRRPRPDAIWIEYEALPWFPWFVENALLPRGVPIVADYDDAVFHRYDRHRLAPVRWLLGGKIDGVMRRSALVVAGNAYLAERAQGAGARRIETVPTVVDLDSYTVASRPAGSALRVGWIGTPETWAAFARETCDTLLPVLEPHNATFVAVGAGLTPERQGRLDIQPWSEETEVTQIQSMDIGIMPLTDTPWARGKCGYKLIQYMACGLPVVASPVGVNAEIVEHGVNGFLARTDDEWREAISTLLSDADLRRRMGAAGRRKVEERYSLQVWGPRVAEMIAEVAG